MHFKPIQTDDDYNAALGRIEELFDAKLGTPRGDELEILVMLAEAYEEKHFPITAPDPIAFIEYYIESRGLTRRDLEPYIGSRARVSEVLNRRRALSLRMIRSLHQGLGMPCSVLIQSYPLENKKQAGMNYDLQPDMTTVGQSLREDSDPDYETFSE